MDHADFTDAQLKQHALAVIGDPRTEYVDDCPLCAESVKRGLWPTTPEGRRV